MQTIFSFVEFMVGHPASFLVVFFFFILFMLASASLNLAMDSRK